uniref:CUB domain containing protein 1a n=1 Tax=Anabas testudineus TaxID=64144 RepID=A0A3Q1HUW5_ANATE
MSVTPDPKTSIIISRVTSEPDCSVCVKTPKQTYCTAVSCSGDIVQAETTLFPDFNRTFTWDLKVVSTRTFQLDFPETGMRQIPKEETCPDEHTYSLITYLRTGPAAIGTFCKGGPVTTILARYKGRVSLQVSANQKLEPVDFKLTVGPESTLIAIVKVNLPRGVSDTDFLTPNYPDSFPDKQQMQWNFTVPAMHNYTVHFRKHTDPECIKNDVEVEYLKEDKKPTKLTVTDPQPKHEQGNFNMVLRNCETNTTLQGLSLNYRVSVMRSGHPGRVVTAGTHSRLVDPKHQIRLWSIELLYVKKINVAEGTKAELSFLDCLKEDMLSFCVFLTTGCQNVSSCPASSLTVPKLDSCLPMPLHSFTWHINVPEESTVELVSPTGSLRQSLPGQECNQTVSLTLTDEDGVSVGDFCSDGIIQKVQVHTNISITAKARDFRKTTGPFLNVSFSQEISETIIYRVTPKMSSPTVLATPNWPQGMTSFSSASWILTLPSQYQADIQFVNVSQPRCQEGHTGITVKMLGYEEEMLSHREDDPPPKTLSVPESFYLNMSNCVPEEGSFGVLTKIVLQKTSNLLPIILGIAGAFLLLLILLVVICVVMKKKKKARTNKDSSIYMGKGNIFRPGDNHFTKSRSENNSHIYQSIDDAMVYGHLLNKSNYADNLPDHFKGMQVDSYRTFTGPVDGSLPVIQEPEPEPEMDLYKPLDPSETFIPSRPRTPIDRQDSLIFQDRRMMDNELYTFKSTGEINTIQLFDVNPEPQWQMTEESL